MVDQPWPKQADSVTNLRSVSSVPVVDLGILLPDCTPRMTRILDAALDLFADRGYQATTMEDIGAVLNVRGPSLYKHVASKHELLRLLMLGGMALLHRDHRNAVDSSDKVAVQLRRAVEAHVRYHSRYRREVLVGNRELSGLDAPTSAEVRRLRKDYIGSFRSLIVRGVDEGDFSVRSPKLAAYTILDMGIGLSLWFRDDGDFTVDQIAYHYGDLAMRVVGR